MPETFIHMTTPWKLTKHPEVWKIFDRKKNSSEDDVDYITEKFDDDRKFLIEKTTDVDLEPSPFFRIPDGGLYLF